MFFIIIVIKKRMRSMKRNQLPLCLITLFFLTSCLSDDETPVSEQRPIDQQLTNALRNAAPDRTTSYFSLPSGNNLSQIPQDPKNPLTEEKVALGRLLYHETALAVNAIRPEGMLTYSCASCHHVQAGFQAGVRQGLSDGGLGFGNAGEGRHRNPLYAPDSLDVQPVRTPSTLNIAYQTNVLWNGQFGATGVNRGTEDRWTEGTPIAVNHLGFEGIETQAIAGLGVHRMDSDTTLIFRTSYQDLYDAAFGQIPADERYTRETTGLAIAAYERTLLANQAPFQRYLRGETGALSDRQKAGALLFFGKANCVSCHTGPALNSMEFHALGMDDLLGAGVNFSKPDDAAHRGRGGFTGQPEDDYQFKVPQLYNLKDSPFYGHGGTFGSVYEVVRYKNEARAEKAAVPPEQLDELFRPLALSEEEVQQLTDFIENGLYDPELVRYVPDRLPSGQSFPNNDEPSRRDLNFPEGE